MKDPTRRLRYATRRAKSDVANKLVSMFLHELSRRISQDWPVKTTSDEYARLVLGAFGSRCPYCSCDLEGDDPVIEHLDGMNRYRAGLHVPGNVLVACKRCNGEKRRDDSLKKLLLAGSGWASFLSHDGTHCDPGCHTCEYWKSMWNEDAERRVRMRENLERISSFRSGFKEFNDTYPGLMETLPALLTKLYSDCQAFAEKEIGLLLDRAGPSSS